MFRITLSKIIGLKLAAVGLWLAGGSFGWACALFFACDVWILGNLFLPGAAGLVAVRTRFVTDQPEIWLTIDDGPDSRDTPRLLDALDRHGARATFFLIGERAAQHPELVAEIARRGHEIGHHTHTHPLGTFWCATPGRVRRELDQGLAALAPFTPRRFRTPVGIKNPFLARALAERKLHCVAWQVRSRDSFARDPDRVVARIMRRVRPGAIVLMHEGPSLHPAIRVTAIARLLDALTVRGFRCVIPADEQLR